MAADPVRQQLGVVGGRSHHERRPEAGAEGDLGLDAEADLEPEVLENFRLANPVVLFSLTLGATEYGD